MSWLQRTLRNLYTDRHRSRHDTPEQAARRGRSWSEPNGRLLVVSLEEVLEDA